MAKLYIANTKKQAEDFCYRMPGQNGVRKQRIEIGQQIAISGGDLSTLEIDAIVDQHAMYGMVCVDALDRTKEFIGLCYSIGKPVTIGKMEIALAHNDDVLTDRGKELRKEAAVSVNNALEQQTDGLQKLDISVQEDNAPQGVVPIAEGIRVQREAHAPRPSSQKPGGRRRAA